LRPVWREAPALLDLKNRDAGKAGLLERILGVSARTIELCLEDLVVDCPWRERAQYFDLFFWEEAWRHLFAGESPARQFLIQYARGADPATGRLRMCYPGPPDQSSIVDFSLSYPDLVLRHGRQTGEWELVRSLMPCARAAVEGWQEFDRGHLLVEPDGWVFLDNSDDFLRAPCSAALNACYARGYASLAELESALGNHEAAARFSGKAARIRRAFRQTFLVEGRLLDSTGVPELERRDIWNYHFPADRELWDWKAKDQSFVLTLTLEVRRETELHFAARGGFRVWLDSELKMDEPDGCGWGRSVLQSWSGFRVAPGFHRLTAQVAFFWADWEIWISTLRRGEVLLHPGTSSRSAWEITQPASEPGVVWDQAAAEARAWSCPMWNQITVGYAAHLGLLEPDEAVAMLKSCLPETYDTPWRKRTTPFFSTITSDSGRLARRVLPCHVPASAWHFTEALRQHGLGKEAADYCLMLYGGMLERGATTWWEEWGDRSSNCHAWACFGIPVLFENL
ncbi:MAG: hypothetical protein N2322_00505, partial [Terrimicrobiaceae bacterium]|nr:hypothetical protein [Terrimicrobiaceae bacterium]